MILDKGGPTSVADLIEFETYLVEELEKEFQKKLLRKSLMLNVHDW
jgi:hypothetical protein